MRIVDVVEITKPIASPIRNAYIDFSKMTASLVAVVTDVMRDGRRVVGYGLSGFPKAGGGEGGGWHGHFADAQSASIVAYALLDDGRTACPLGRRTASP